MIPANFGGFNKLREHKSQHTLFTEMKGLQTTTDNPTFITQDSEVGFALEEERCVLIFVRTFLGVCINISLFKFVMSMSNILFILVPFYLLDLELL